MTCARPPRFLQPASSASDRRECAIATAPATTERQRRFERRVGQLVDAQRAHQRVPPNPGPRARRADDDAGLRTAEQLVSAEAPRVHAGGEAGPRGGLVAPAPPARLRQPSHPLPRSSKSGTWKRAPAQSAPRAAGRSVNPSIWKLDGCTRSSSGGAVVMAARVVADARAVGRADFAQRRARLRHHVRAPGSRRRFPRARRARRSPRGPTPARRGRAASRPRCC